MREPAGGGKGGDIFCEEVAVEVVGCVSDEMDCVSGVDSEGVDVEEGEGTSDGEGEGEEPSAFCLIKLCIANTY